MGTMLLFDGIKTWFLSIFDNIPKAIFFFFAAFTSAIDALQALLRKLAGLDRYYVKGAEVVRQDPLTEFVYGILGIGNNVNTYRALNTVFWSLSIFALIVLVLSTMVAMIKSHYNEDYQATNPWKYIYTAIKAILTYAIMPIVVVLGLQISGLILRTLDNITAGTDEGKVVSIYGANVVSGKFKAQILDGKRVYTQYDFFGVGSPTTSQTFGGMLFTAAAYSANRARGDGYTMGSGSITIEEAQRTGIFGQSSAEYDRLQTAEDKREYIAYQIDFAFANNIPLQSSISMPTLAYDYFDIRYVPGTNFIGGSPSLRSFSKYNVTAVWMFYDLWSFQFIVAFGGAVTVIGLIISIILGMMMRLIQGAALFLIYPLMVSIAPLDNFKAFKSWGTKFMAQVLMAYGAIVGMNVVMLILPYVQEIAWFGTGFGFGIINAIINLIILIVGLLLIKDFIGIVSGFIGAADAAGEGEKYKAGVTNAVKQGAKITTATGGLVARPMAMAGLKAGRRVGKAISHAHTSNMDRRALQNSADDFFTLGGNDGIDALSEETAEYTGLNSMSAINAKFSGDDDVSKGKREVAAAALQAKAKAKAEGKTEAQQDLAAKEAAQAKMKETIGDDGMTLYDSAMYKQNEKIKDVKKNGTKDEKKALKRFTRAQNARDKLDYKGDALYSANDEGNYNAKRNAAGAFFGELAGGAQGIPAKIGRGVKKLGSKEGRAELRSNIGDGFVKLGSGAKQIGDQIGKAIDGAKIGKTIADSFLKSMNSIGEATGLDKAIGGLKGMLQNGLTLKNSPLEKKAEGDALQRANADRAEASARSQAKLSEQTNALLKQLLESNKEVKRAVDASSASRTYTGGGGSSGG